MMGAPNPADDPAVRDVCLEPCADCLKDAGIEVLEPLDPNAAIGRLL